MARVGIRSVEIDISGLIIRAQSVAKAEQQKHRHITNAVSEFAHGNKLFIAKTYRKRDNS
jgi:hypothetical protein